MTSLARETIEQTVRSAYQARIAGNLDGVMRHFHDGAHFAIVGSPAASPVPMHASGAAAVREVMRRLIEGFEFGGAEILDLLVDGSRAAVHSRVRLRRPGTQDWHMTELVDILRFEGDRIVSFHQFADTALAARLAAG